MEKQEEEIKSRYCSGIITGQLVIDSTYKLKAKDKIFRLNKKYGDIKRNVVV